MKQALERQTATANILNVVSQSPTDTQPVFEAIVLTAVRLLRCDMSIVMICEPPVYWVAASATPEGLFNELTLIKQPIDPSANFPSRTIVEKRALYLPDWSLIDLPEHERHIHETVGVNSALYLPLMREGECVGLLTLGGKQANIFGDNEIALAESFRDQALIAIENTRLFNETQETLERQTATADILKVIASSPSDVQPVFEAIAERSTRLVSGFSTGVHRLIDGQQHLKAFTRISPEADAVIQAAFPRPLADLTGAEQIRNGEIFEITDTELEFAQQPSLLEMARKRGYRSMVIVPLMRGREPIGLINVTRRQTGRFAAHHVNLLKTFADQAVIAIENARLFNETREALERQTATADILKVIANSPTNVQPVFEAIAERSKRLVDALSTTVFRLEDGVMQLRAFTLTNPEADATLQAMFPAPLSNFSWGEAIGSGKIYRVVDTELEIEGMRELARQRGYRSMLFVPLLRDRKPIGVIAVTRVEPGPFVELHVQLLQTFADQAVIAIENTRLFNETNEALERQTATAEVLRVIASSPTDVRPVLDAIVESARKLCEASDAYVALKDGDYLVFQAHHGSIPVAWNRRPINRQWPAGRAVVDGKSVHLRDVLAREGDEFPGGQEIARHDGTRSVLTVPLMREGASIGVIILRRTEVRPFTDKQIALMKTFSDQAVIAIENVRLFDEVKAKTRDLEESLQQQTATADVLEAISRSAFDLNPVFETVAESSVKLCGSERAIIFRFDGELLRVAAAFNAPHHLMDWLERNPLRAGRHSVAARAALERRTIHVRDVLADPEHTYGAKNVEPFRTVLGVPMLKGDDLLGVILVYHNEIRQFTEKQIALVESFADQAVIAISNVNLFEQVQQRTRELSQSLDDLRTAQDRLVQTEKLASLGQLTAGIAHEIKNPLNFVNNFSALSAELIDELDETLAPAPLDQKMRGDVSELTQMLKSNLEKVVQHGKRADSIVKNMLLHSREGAGEQRPADINTLLDESLNLAYHGARAEKPGFNITVQRDFDPDAGTVELFPQEITRAFINLISNGFYAASKRKAENGDANFEPILSAATKNLGIQVEIRIRDNGTGIPSDVKEKIFNPFFTTKPAGEGTGLGLSMSHDIIVKQHGGRIEVDTQPGQFTEFTIVLPRTSNKQ